MSVTSIIALAVATLMVVSLVLGLGVLSLLSGTFDFLFGGSKFTHLKSLKGPSGLAFRFRWDEAKDPIKVDLVKIRLFNPFGEPSQVEVIKEFEPQAESFAMDIDMGEGLVVLYKTAKQNPSQSRVLIEVGSKKEGIQFNEEMPATKFLAKSMRAVETIEDWNKDEDEKSLSFGAQPKLGSIANEPPPNKNVILKMVSNPMFADSLKIDAGGGGAAAAGGGEAAENFAISKVWIAEGCIVCDACEDIYPEVFEVTADTCVIRPDAPLNDGLRVQEAAEACPVEVIKYTKA